MNIQNLEFFLTVCNYLSFAKAAEVLYISPQGLSQCINRMEQKLNTNLFIRTSKGLVMTEDGHKLQKSAQIIVNEFSRCNESIQKKNLIFITVMYHLIAEFPQSIQNLLLNCNPKFQVKVFEATSIEGEGMLRRGETDFTITCDPIEKPSWFYKRKIMETYVVGAVNKLSPLVNEKELGCEIIKDCKIAILNNRNKIHSIFLDWCKEYSFTPNILYEARQVSDICGIVRTNPDIIGIIPHYYSMVFDNNSLSFIRLNLSVEASKARIYLAWSRDRLMSPYKYEFEQYFTSQMRKMQRNYKNTVIKEEKMLV